MEVDHTTHPYPERDTTIYTAHAILKENDVTTASDETEHNNYSKASNESFERDT